MSAPAPTPVPSDVTLLERVASGDERALWELSSRHGSDLRDLAFTILHDPVDAERVVQSTFHEVRYEAARFDPEVVGWRRRSTSRGNELHSFHSLGRPIQASSRPTSNCQSCTGCQGTVFGRLMCRKCG